MNKRPIKMVELNIDGEIVCLPVGEMREYLKKRNIPTDVLRGHY